MAQKLADYGYAVLVPDVYYRHGQYAPFDLNTAFSDPRGAHPGDVDDGQRHPPT